jgi:hypothetical protein
MNKKGDASPDKVERNVHLLARSHKLRHVSETCRGRATDKDAGIDRFDGVRWRVVQLHVSNNKKAKKIVHSQKKEARQQLACKHS